MGLSYTLISFT